MLVKLVQNEPNLLWRYALVRQVHSASMPSHSSDTGMVSPANASAQPLRKLASAGFNATLSPRGVIFMHPFHYSCISFTFPVNTLKFSIGITSIAPPWKSPFTSPIFSSIQPSISRYALFNPSITSSSASHSPRS